MTREEALAILRKENGVVYSEYEEAVDVIEKALADRPHGEWISRRDKRGAHIYSVCSKCNVPYLDNDFPNFCPNCGADMRKEGESN